eukprot:TRINITY_DN8191_c1_g1_i3.p1 TRINITY_DN8191_c1_g1~~TRINITY_DN8191_c1_g1_i3.p1  ORF type:complete len:151 (+),score=21.79 TRINITY_DN8191_c1_g1_i3:2039-2491(+)
MGTILFFGKTLCFLVGTFLIALETAIYDIGLGRNLKESHFNNNGIWTIPNGTTTELQEIFKMISEMPQPSPSFNDEVVWTPSEFGSSSLNMWIRLLFKTLANCLEEEDLNSSQTKALSLVLDVSPSWDVFLGPQSSTCPNITKFSFLFMC